MLKLVGYGQLNKGGYGLCFFMPYHSRNCDGAFLLKEKTKNEMQILQRKM